MPPWCRASAMLLIRPPTTFVSVTLDFIDDSALCLITRYDIQVILILFLASNINVHYQAQAAHIAPPHFSLCGNTITVGTGMKT
jgi:hypothetical protein